MLKKEINEIFVCPRCLDRNKLVKLEEIKTNINSKFEVDYFCNCCETSYFSLSYPYEGGLLAEYFVWDNTYEHKYNKPVILHRIDIAKTKKEFFFISKRFFQLFDKVIQKYNSEEKDAYEKMKIEYNRFCKQDKNNEELEEKECEPDSVYYPDNTK